MKKVFVALLLAVCMASSTVMTASAAYGKNILSEKVVTDSGNVNLAEWYQLEKEGKGSWQTMEIDPYVANPIGGASMIVEPYASADLSKGDVRLTFDVLKAADDAPAGEDYGTHLYAIIEPADGSAATKVGDPNSYYMYINGGLLVAGYSYNDGTDGIFYSDAGCKTPISYTADYTAFTMAPGKMTITYTKDRTIGVSLNDRTVYIKNAFPASYVTGEMRFGFMDWGYLQVDNLVLEQAVGAEAAAVSPAAVTDAYVKSVSVGSPIGYIEPQHTVDLSNGDVTFSVDISGMAAPHLYAIIEKAENTSATNGAGAIGKTAASGTDFYCYLHDGAIAGTNAYNILGAGNVFYQDRACETAVSHSADFIVYPLAENAALEFTFTADGVIGVTHNGLTYYIKNAFPADLCSGEVRVGIGFWNTVNFDNVVLKQGGEQLMANDFSGEWATKEGNEIFANLTEDVDNDAQEVPDPAPSDYDKLAETGFERGWNADKESGGICYSENAKHIIAGGYASVNTDENQRLVLRQRISVDESCDKVFDAEGSLAFGSLEDKFGFAIGMPAANTAVDDSGFLYFANEGGTTHLVLGGTDYDLGKDLVGEGETPVVLNALADGKLNVKVGEADYAFENVNFDGYFAILSKGEGDATVIVGQAFKVTNYSYNKSEGGELAVNFNTGYYDKENWTMQSLKANYFNEPERARGITFENGRLNFDGVGIMTYFATTKRYSEYILEFDYIQPHDLPTTYANGGFLGTFAVCIASNASSGYNNSNMFSPFYYDGYGYVQCTYATSGVYEGSSTSGKWNFYNADKDVVTAMKFVVAEEKVSVYVQDITETEFDAENYHLMGTWEVGNTYGYVCFAGDEGTVQSFDNIRITPIDDPNPEQVRKNIEEFVDRRPIADDHVDLAAPVIEADGNVVSWEAVKDAEGYVVTVNGVEQSEQTATEYTLTEAGTYTVTVRAVGHSAFINGDSPESNTLTVTVTQTGTDTSDSGSSGNSGSEGQGGGCSGAAGASAFGLVALFAAALAKRRH